MATPVNAPLPVGTVTFLLTDVEGSTTGWDAKVHLHHIYAKLNLANRAQLTAEVTRRDGWAKTISTA